MKYKTILLGIMFCIILGGCRMKNENKENNKYFISVQEYSGKEYPSNEKQERWDYIKENQNDIEAYAVDWFKKKYNFDVKVNHIYPQNGAAIAIVEWLDDINLKMPIVMGLDEGNKRITGVNTSAMQLDNTIMSYLVHKIYEEEFNNLNKFVVDFCKENNLYGLTDEYVSNMAHFAGYRDNVYYLSASSIGYQSTLTKFIKNPFISNQELRTSFESDILSIKEKTGEEVIDTNIVISLYSKDNKLDRDILNKLENVFLAQEGLPDFNYGLILNENKIDTRVDMTASIAYPEAPTETGFLRIKGSK